MKVIGAMADGFPTPEQRRVVELPFDAKTLVVADAGTGKTDILVARLAHLIDRELLAPGREVLVLSFSRAAVGEIRHRVRRQESAASYAHAATFDSFATRLLDGVLGNGSWSEAGYDGRIQACVELIHANEEARTRLADFQHILVDEIQDLVGVRSDLVRAILQHHSGGFTLLGDPAQAIYDWQDSDSPAGDRESLFDWVRSTVGANLEEHRLSTNFRARSDTALVALQYGKELNDPHPDYPAVASGLLTLCRDLPSLGDLATASVALKRRPGTVALLCRTNGRALAVSGELRRRNVSHRLQPRATAHAIAPWIGRLLAETDGSTIGRRAFTELYAERSESDWPSPQDAWRMLNRLAPGPIDMLNISAVANRLRLRRVPDEMVSTPPSKVVVSTIHRAKGLEFDAVALAYPEDFRNEEDRVPDETRILYVGLTRARDDLYTFDPPDNGPLRLERAIDRWVQTGWQWWQRRGFEVRGDDIAGNQPTGGHIVMDDAQAVQEYLWTSVQPGDPVTFTLEKHSVVGLPRAYYAARHDGRLVGLTSEDFASDLHAWLQARDDRAVQWPQRIEDLYVEGVDTVAGTPAAGANAGLGTSGIWLRCRVVGLGRLVSEAADGASV